MNTSNSFWTYVYARISARKVAFLATFFVVVFTSYAFLTVIDFLPEPINEDASQAKDTNIISPIDQAKRLFNGGLSPKKATEETEDSTLRIVIPEGSATSTDTDQSSTEGVFQGDPLPMKIIFDSLKKEVKVLNPTSNKVADLDNSLLSGVVRHPDSADFSDKGNIFILGHSSYLPNVMNKNFQAFNGIQNLTWGDLVRVQSSDTEYVYRVDKVFKAKTSDVVVPNTPGEARLTLATCNSFGTKDDRFVVEAELIETKTL